VEGKEDSVETDSTVRSVSRGRVGEIESRSCVGIEEDGRGSEGNAGSNGCIWRKTGSNVGCVDCAREVFGRKGP
jgi:hypothetical protein